VVFLTLKIRKIFYYFNLIAIEKEKENKLWLTILIGWSA